MSNTENKKSISQSLQDFLNLPPIVDFEDYIDFPNDQPHSVARSTQKPFSKSNYVEASDTATSHSDDWWEDIFDTSTTSVDTVGGKVNVSSSGCVQPSATPSFILGSSPVYSPIEISQVMNELIARNNAELNEFDNIGKNTLSETMTSINTVREVSTEMTLEQVLEDWSSSVGGTDDGNMLAMSDMASDRQPWIPVGRESTDNSNTLARMCFGTASNTEIWNPMSIDGDNLDDILFEDASQVMCSSAMYYPSRTGTVMNSEEKQAENECQYVVLSGNNQSPRHRKNCSEENMMRVDWNAFPDGEENRLKELRKVFKPHEFENSSSFSLAAESRPADLTSRLADAIRSSRHSRNSKAKSRQDYMSLPSAERPAQRVFIKGGVRKLGIPLANTKVFSGTSKRMSMATAAEQMWISDLNFNGRPRSSEAVLKSRLLELAEATAIDDVEKANFLSSLLCGEASPMGSIMQRLVFYFMQGLAKRKKGGMTAQEYIGPIQVNFSVMAALERMANKLPYLPFCMDSVNDIVMEFAVGADSIHIIDYSMWGGQWGPLLRSLADRPGGPPLVRITAVEAPPGKPWGAGPSMPAGILKREVMMAAAEAGVSCDWRVVVSSLEDLQPHHLRLQSGEPLAMVACMRLQQLPDSTVVRSNPRDTFLQKIRTWNPSVVILCGFQIEQNTPFFLYRFREALEYFSCLFESFAEVSGQEFADRRLFEQTIWAREIIHTVASEGLERVQREEKVDKWQARMHRCGFREYPFNHEIIHSLRKNVQHYHQSFSLNFSRESLIVNWKGFPVVAAHAWVC